MTITSSELGIMLAADMSDILLAAGYSEESCQLVFDRLADALGQEDMDTLLAVMRDVNLARLRARTLQEEMQNTTSFPERRAK